MPPEPAPQPDDSTPDHALELFSNMEKYWNDTREIVEGFATKYFSPSTPPSELTAQGWMEENARFVSSLWIQWAKAATIAAQEGGRLLGVALRERRETEEGK